MASSTALPAQTTEARLRAAFDAMTPAERQLASHILKNYPVAALGSITVLAKAAGVSTPTIVRLVQKLGYKGYPAFQAALRDEVEERLVSPLMKHDRWAQNAPKTHLLNAFGDAVLANLQATLAEIDHDDFDRLAALVADRDRKVYAMGGRITHALADYFITHLRVIRPGVTLISDMSNTWPPALLDIRAGDVLVVFDIRRYENAVLQVAEEARGQGAEVVLITDQWVSPAAAFAQHRLVAHVEAPSAWDSTVAMQLLVETLLAAVQALTWEDTQARMTRLEELYARTRLFRGRK
jgi:DNA-binding MurR/RpiR family transcriptional regulator